MADIVGTPGNDTLNGTPSGDTIAGWGGDDTLNGGDGNDILYGDEDDFSIVGYVITGNDTLNGGLGNDFLYGGPGTDIMTGGLGSDVYGVHEVTDVVTELAGEGDNDTVQSTISYTLPANVEDLILYGNGLVGTGSGANNQLTANGSGISLYGLAGDDWLWSSASGGNLLDGGSGNDRIFSYDGADTLAGGTGNDTFRASKSGFNGDTITDFSVGDVIVFTETALAGFTFNLVGNTLNFAGGSLTLSAPINGTIVATEVAGGGQTEVHLTIQPSAINDVRNDFNGDGRSDVLWRADGGQMTSWLGGANGGFSENSANTSVFVAISWQVVGTGDFNGDGRDDIVWRNIDTGQMTNWLGAANGGHSDNSVNASTSVATSWNIAGVGDFNGDGRDDIVWRNENGTMTNWLGTASGAFADNSTNASVTVGTIWHIAGTGDFNGDGRDDILWRNDLGEMTNWLGQADGSFVNNPNASTTVATSWYIAGTGDFNGDGRDDILWRNDVTGDMTNWLGQANGGFVNNPNASTFVSLSWNIYGTGDFNGDGRDDILWRHDDTGDMTNWLGQANGGFVNNANASTWVPKDWTIVETSDFLF
jgi:hypothetical protein